MSEKKSFVLFNDLSIPVKSLSDEEAGKLFKAIFEYQNGGIEQELSGSAEMAFIFVKQQMDRSQEKYDEMCKKNSENAHKKWGPKSLNDTKRSERLSEARKKGTHTKKEWEDMKSLFDCCPRCKGDGPPVKDHIIPIYQGGSDGIDNIQPLCKACNSQKGPEVIDYRPKDWCERLRMPAMPADSDPDPDPDSDTENDNKKDINIKHKYGEYHHVLLTDKQYEGLKDKVDDREKWIKTVDDSIQEKGNIYHIKDFNMAIQKWYKREADKRPPKIKIYVPDEDEEITAEEKAEGERLLQEAGGIDKLLEGKIKNVRGRQ